MFMYYQHFDCIITTIILCYIVENGEWELIDTGNSSVVTEREKESFSRLVFFMVFRRRLLFHMLNTLFPVVLMGFLTVRSPPNVQDVK